VVRASSLRYGRADKMPAPQPDSWRSWDFGFAICFGFQFSDFAR
jgi:hypothetical protein